MRRLSLYGSWLIAGNLVLVIWHLFVLGKLDPEMTGRQLGLFGLAIGAISVATAILLWTRWRRLAGLLLVAYLGAGFAIGGYEHFLSAGPDNVFTMPRGAWVRSFQVSAVLLVLAEMLGCWLGIRAASSPDLATASSSR